MCFRIMLCVSLGQRNLLTPNEARTGWRAMSTSKRDRFGGRDERVLPEMTIIKKKMDEFCYTSAAVSKVGHTAYHGLTPSVLLVEWWKVGRGLISFGDTGLLLQNWSPFGNNASSRTDDQTGLFIKPNKNLLIPSTISTAPHQTAMRVTGRWITRVVASLCSAWYDLKASAVAKKTKLKRGLDM